MLHVCDCSCNCPPPNSTMGTSINAPRDNDGELWCARTPMHTNAQSSRARFAFVDADIEAIRSLEYVIPSCGLRVCVHLPWNSAVQNAAQWWCMEYNTKMEWNNSLGYEAEARSDRDFLWISCGENQSPNVFDKFNTKIAMFICNGHWKLYIASEQMHRIVCIVAIVDIITFQRIYCTYILQNVIHIPAMRITRTTITSVIESFVVFLHKALVFCFSLGVTGCPSLLSRNGIESKRHIIYICNNIFPRHIFLCVCVCVKLDT